MKLFLKRKGPLSKMGHETQPIPLKEALIMDSILADHWQVNAGDPTALTRLLALPELVVTQVEYAAWRGGLVLHCTLVATRAPCPTCGQYSTTLHQVQPRTVRDLAWAGHHCYLQFPARRFACATCRGPFTERLDAIAPYARMTQRYAAALVAQCRNTPLRTVARREALGYKAVEGCFYRAAPAAPEAPPPGLVRRLGLDEIALKKGQHYVLVVSDLDRKCVLTILPERTQAALSAYFATWTPAQRAAVTDVAVDLWEPYHLAVRACLPQARCTADRFHVMKNLNERLTEARRGLQRALSVEERAALKGCRWVLVKNQVNLTTAEQAQLAAIYTAAPALGRAHELKEEFRTIFETVDDRTTARARLQSWMSAVEQTGEAHLGKFVGTLRNWWEAILNYFPQRLSSGFVEGLNNKLKLIKRRAFGYRNFDHFRLRVLVECDGTP